MLSDAQKKRMVLRRMELVHVILLFALLIVLARLIELQIIRGEAYEEQAREQHFSGIVLPAKRGEILSRSSKTGELSILATNTTLDLLYVDPFVAKEKRAIARLLADTLLTEAFDAACRTGEEECPRELRSYYAAVFDPLFTGATLPSLHNVLPLRDTVRDQFALDIERRISEEFVSFVPLLYGATKLQLRDVERLGIPGISALPEQRLIYGNPLLIPDFERRRIARIFSPLLQLDQESLMGRLRQRRLRYVPIMRRLPPELSKLVKKLKEESAAKTAAERQSLLIQGKKEAADAVEDPLRGIALPPEHWRFYPDGTVASQVVGFLSFAQQAQNGIERTFDHELRGQEGRISAVTDPFGGQIVSEEQSIVQAYDGRTVVLTLDRYLQKQAEEILAKAVQEFHADSGQVVIMDPLTGRILVMANAPLVESNNYSIVYEKEPITLSPEQEPSIVVEIIHPQTNDLVVRAYLNDLTPEGRSRMSPELQNELEALEELYDLPDLMRTYVYLGENSRWEIFPITDPATGQRRWLKYVNRIGVGAYVNRVVQEIYEPGSVFKPITMAIALDQGEVRPDDMYEDEGPVHIEEYIIENALNRHFGTVTMTNCLSFSINTCMTSVSAKLGKKLFANYIERFGFGHISSIQLDDEQPGQVLDWRRWSDALLATAAYGQGISATPLQMVTAYSVLANGGQLMKPTIIDRWIDPHGTIAEISPQVLGRVITEEAAATVTAMLVRGANEGYAKRGKVKGYRIAGKTGTSQIAGPGGKYEKYGSGTTITSFGGYGPIDHPRFAMIVKFDRPRTVEFGERSAAPVFKEIATLLFEYYGIPPDEK